MNNKKLRGHDKPRDAMKADHLDISKPDRQSKIQSAVASPEQISSKSSFSFGGESNIWESRIANKTQTIQKVLNRLGLQNKVKEEKKNQELEVLIGNIVQNCIGTIDTESNMQQYEKVYGAEYKEMVKQYSKNNTVSAIIVSELTQIQKINLLSQQGFMAVIKDIRIFLKRISLLSNAIVEHNLFETIILLIIVLNSIKMALDDPLTQEDSNPLIQNIFIALYVIQMVLKIMAYGFIFNEKAYLRDLWNVLDFIIVLTSLLPLFITIGFSVNSLRAIRVLRPLKTITKIKALKMIVSTLFYSFSLVMDSLYILLFVMLVFSIAGTQLFSGVLKNKCIEVATGYITKQMCVHGTTCSEGFICGKGIENPNFSITNFDTLLWSMLTVFQTFTMQGWSDIMIDLQTAYSPFSFIYSVLIVFICEYVLMNMTMAILKYKYSQVKGNTIEEDEEDQTEYEPEFLKKLGIFKNITNLSPEPPLERYMSIDKIFAGSLEFQDSRQYMMNHPLVDEISSLKNIKRKTLKMNSMIKNKKIDLSKLNYDGKIQEFKWDAKALHFQSIDPLINNNNSHQSVKTLRNLDNKQVKQQKQQQSDYQKQQVLSISNKSRDDGQYSDSSDDQQHQQYDINEKLYQIQLKIGTRKNIPQQQQNLGFQKREKKVDFQNIKNQQGKRKIDKKQMKQFNDTLRLVQDATDKKTYDANYEINMPQINFNQFKTDQLFQRFGDLGQFGLKRYQKPNQLQYFSIKQKPKHNLLQKKHETNIVKQIAQENALDIKQLQLVNQLSKKQMKCRIRNKQDMNIQNNYDISRVLIFKKSQQSEEKKKQLEENIQSLTFRVTYRASSLNDSKVNTAGNKEANIFKRNLNSEYKGLKIPQTLQNKDVKEKSIMRDGSQLVSRTANYIRMLQKHKMDEKIEMEQDRIMTIFFKKQKSENHTKSEEQKKANASVNFEKQYNTIKENDIFNSHGSIIMSQPIKPINASSSSQYLDSINIKDEQYQIYMRGFFGILNVIRKKTLLFITRPVYDNLMLILVIANTLTLSLNGLVDTSQPQFTNINLAFTIAFAIDLTLKIFAYGFEFFGDIMNIFDSFVVSISIVQLSLGTGSNLTALRSIRILRAFRVLRITRLIRSLNYMKIVMSVVSSVITEFVYIFMLLALFIFIYTLLGMQIFGGQLLPSQITGIRQNFDNFFNAVFAVFQILTLENWNDIQIAVLTSPIGYVSIFYFLSWIFIGNWILLNLLQAILLDGFDKDSSPETPDEDQEQDGIQEEQHPPQLQEQNDGTKTNINSFDSNEEDTYDDLSLLMFYPTTTIRVIATKIIKSPVFQNIIIFVIALSSVKLVVDTYLPKIGKAAEVSDIIDIVFNSIFITESLLKIISRGFFIGPNSYLKDSWCQLDFFIVVTGIIDMSLGTIDLSILKLFRTLRPLRIVSRNPDMKVIISSLAQSMLGIFNVIIIILCVFLMFGILGINLLQNKLAFCNYSTELIHGHYGPYGVTQSDCQTAGGVWTTQFINFDNILSSLLSLYVFSTRQNWPYYVYTLIDAGDQAPTKDNNQLLYMLFSFVIIFVCSYFFMDLLVGVLFMNFHEAEQKIRPKKLSDKQINWMNLQKIIIQQDPSFELYLKPQNPFRAFFHRIVTARLFEIFITLCIVGNIVVMAIGTDDQTDEKQKTLSTINFVFSIIFICEMTLKVFAYSKAYFLSGWNLFDFFVVMASVLDIIMSFTGTTTQQSSTITILPQIARIFRVLRITRLLRMFKRFKGLQKLIETFIFAFPSLARGLSIVALFLFISSVLASYLFGNIGHDYSGYIDENRNFSNFHSSLQTLFIITTGQNWYFYMFESTQLGYLTCNDGTESCVNMAYLIFWLIYVFFSQKVFMELFVLIVLDQFESNYIKQNNPLGIFSLFEEDFRSNWIESTTKYHSQKIEAKKLLDFLLSLKQPLGLGKRQLLKNYEEELRENQKISEEEIASNIKQLDMKLKKNGAKLLQKMDIIKNRVYLGYHETFYYFAKLTFQAEIYENATIQQKQMLEEIHKVSEQKLQEMMPQGNNFEFQQHQYENQQPLNPIQLILFSQMITKSWHNYSTKFNSEKQAEKAKQNNQNNVNDSLNNSCSSEVVEAELEKLQIQKKIYKRQGFIEGFQNQEIQFVSMPNIDDHYQNEKKRTRKGISQRRNQQKNHESLSQSKK